MFSFLSKKFELQRINNYFEKLIFILIFINFILTLYIQYDPTSIHIILFFSFVTFLLNSCSIMNKASQIDGGSMMAFSYYHGYLKLIISREVEGGLEERIANYIDKNKLEESSFPCKKLFILIPKSSYIPPDLKSHTYGWMDSAQSLEPLQIDMAGVKGRIYHNSVYKISNPEENKKPTYLVAEGATPIRTFYETSKNDTYFTTRFSTDSLKDLIYNFYITLEEIISRDESIREMIEIIYYDDYDSRNKRINVAKLILERIETYKNEETLRSQDK